MDFQTTTETNELTKTQKVKKKIAELKKLEKIQKDIATCQARIKRLKEQKRELEAKYGI